MSFLRAAAGWIVWNVPCGWLAPHLFGFSVKVKKRRVK